MALVKQKKSITYEETKRKGIHYLVDEPQVASATWELFSRLISNLDPEKMNDTRVRSSTLYYTGMMLELRPLIGYILIPELFTSI